MFGVGHRTVQRWVTRWRVTGSVAASPKGGGWRSPIELAVLTSLIADAPDGRCAELCGTYNRRVPRAQRTTGHQSVASDAPGRICAPKKTVAAERNRSARRPREARCPRNVGAAGRSCAPRFVDEAGANIAMGAVGSISRPS